MRKLAILLAFFLPFVGFGQQVLSGDVLQLRPGNAPGAMEGRMYYKAGDSQFYYWNGVEWLPIGGGGSTGNYSFDGDYLLHGTDTIMFTGAGIPYMWHNLGINDLESSAPPETYITRNEGSQVLSEVEVLQANVKHYGAIGDGVTDDLAAINAAISTGKPIYFPDGTYLVSAGLVVPPNQEVIMDGTLLYDGPLGETALKIGDETTLTRRKTYKLDVQYKTNPDWSDTNNIAVQLVNFNTSEVTVTKIQGAAVGLSCWGDAAGFAYNTFYLGEFISNQLAIDLTAVNAGWNNQNLFLNGRIWVWSDVYNSTYRYGVRLTNNDIPIEQYANNNTFLNTSFELWQPDLIDGAQAIPIVLAAARNNDFIDIRDERNSDTIATSYNRSHSNKIEPLFGYAFIGYKGRYGGDWDQKVTAYNRPHYTIFEVNDMSKRAVKYDATRTSIYGMMFSASTFNTKYKAASDVTVNDTSLILGSGSRGVGIYVDANINDTYVCKFEHSGGLLGTWGVKLYNSDSVDISHEQELIKGADFQFIYDVTFGNFYRGPGFYNRISFTVVSDTVAFIEPFIRGNDDFNLTGFTVRCTNRNAKVWDAFGYKDLFALDAPIDDGRTWQEGAEVVNDYAKNNIRKWVYTDATWVPVQTLAKQRQVYKVNDITKLVTPYNDTKVAAKELMFIATTGPLFSNIGSLVLTDTSLIFPNTSRGVGIFIDVDSAMVFNAIYDYLGDVHAHWGIKFYDNDSIDLGYDFDLVEGLDFNFSADPYHGGYYQAEVGDDITFRIIDSRPKYMYLFIQGATDLNLQGFDVECLTDVTKSWDMFGYNQFAAEIPPTYGKWVNGDVVLNDTGSNPFSWTYNGSEWVEYNEPVVWKNTWAQQVYNKNEMVYDNGWTMIANKETAERPAPQPTGQLLWVLPDSPTWNNQSLAGSFIATGFRHTFDTAAYITEVRGWIPTVSPDHEYQFMYVNRTNPANINYTYSPKFLPEQVGWFSDVPTTVLLAKGTILDVFLISADHSTTSVLNANYSYQTKNNVADPATGEIYQAGSLPSILGISKTDVDAIDRSTELEALTIGDLIAFGGITYTISSATDEITFIDFEVTPTTTQIDAASTPVTFTRYISADVDYVEIIDNWVGYPNSNGIIQADGFLNPTVTDDAYGINIEYQTAEISDDWDLVASSEDIGGGSSAYGTYFFQKESNITVLDDNWETICQLVTPQLDAGTYEYKFSWTFSYSSTATSAIFRFSIDGGINWDEFWMEPKDLTNEQPMFYSFPKVDIAKEYDIILQARKETAGAVLTINFVDIILDRKQ